MLKSKTGDSVQKTAPGFEKKSGAMADIILTFTLPHL